MFDLIKRLFSSEAPDTTVESSEQTEQKLNRVAPVAPVPTTAEGSLPQTTEPAAVEIDRTFVCRETILGRSERIEAYEIRMSRRLRAGLLDRSDRVQMMQDDALLRNVAATGVAQLLGERQAYIHLAPGSLEHPLLERLSPSNLVIIVDSRSSQLPDELAVHRRLALLRDRGYRYGWLLRRDAPELEPFLQACDVIQIEASAFDGMQLQKLPPQLRKIRLPKLPPLKLLASSLQSHDDFSFCLQNGFDLFEGPFVASRDNWHVPKSEVNRLRVLELLNLVRSEADYDQIAHHLRLEPVLTFKLLRYINSPAVGLQRQVTSIAQSLVILGHEKFYRWLSLLLFDTRKQSYRERMLTEQALTRGRFMEGLAGHGKVPATPEHLFMAGMFSMLDIIMGQPLKDIVGQIALPEAVRQALLGQEGIYNDVLTLARQIEFNQTDLIASATDRCGVDDATVSRAMIEALAWAEMLSKTDQTP